MSDILEFDPNDPLPCSAFLEAMRGVFEATAPKKFKQNKEVWSRMEKSVLAANAHFAQKFQKDANAKVLNSHTVYEEKMETVKKEIASNIQEIAKAERQVVLHREENEGLKLKISEMEKGVDELIKKHQSSEEQEQLQTADKEVSEKNKIIDQLKVITKRAELEVEFIELEKRRAIKYSELQVLELQKETIKLRINDFEGAQDAIAASMKSDHGT